MQPPTPSLLTLEELSNRVAEEATAYTGTSWGLALRKVPRFNARSIRAHVTNPMPEDWVLAVATRERISTRGLHILIKGLASKGFVSIAVAKKFVQHEATATTNESHSIWAPPSIPSNTTGANLLLVRAQAGLHS